MVGAGNYRYELIRDFCKMPPGKSLGVVSRVAADEQDRIYVFQRKDPPVVVFDRDGAYLGAWGTGEVTDPHGLKIVDGVVYTTNRTTRWRNHSPWTASRCWSLASVACIPTLAAKGHLGWPSARRGRSTIPPR